MAETAYLIAGCGVSGKAAARLAAYLNLTYYLADENNTPELQAFAASLNPAPVGTFFGWNDSVELPSGVETVLSPGIRKGTPFRTALEKSSASCYGELEFALRHLPCPYVGITGTNGKTTVTELTTALFCAAGVKAEAAGNIGAALSEAVIHARETALELAVIEISSFQLETMTAFPRPAAAALLNIASDHIDRHATLEEYAATKLRLFPSSRSKAILNKNTISYGEKYLPAGTQLCTFTCDVSGADLTFDGCWIRYQNRKVFDYSTMALKGYHNCENVQAALALLVEVCGEDVLKNAAVHEALRNFKPSAHRQEVFLQKNGVTYVDDSKATNPHAVNAALKSLPPESKVNLILGGLDKAMDFTELIPYLGNVRKVYVIGSCADRICSVLTGVVPLERYESFEDAVRSACAAAENGNYVMLSPACASMDMFRSYKERGERFKALVCEYTAG
jgi:UDP-N-acetylmuramoylalanine--D-glutamate ligase